MNTLAFIAAAIVLGLVVLAKIPGLEHTVRPAIDLVFTGLKAVLENSVSWSIWLFKMLLASHIEVIRHLVMSAESLDPSHEIRKMSDE
jgi:small basic protein